MDPNFQWIYLIFFLMIPLARIIPRLMARRRRDSESFQTMDQSQSKPNYGEQELSAPAKEIPEKPATKNMLVLGELHRGRRTFESIKKNTGLSNNELDSILDSLEKNGMLKVHQKQGFFGTKIELHPTDKGFKEYYS